MLLLKLRSTSANRCAKNVRVQAVVIAELEFDDIERQALLLTLCQVSTHATFGARRVTLMDTALARTWAKS